MSSPFHPASEQPKCAELLAVTMGLELFGEQEAGALSHVLQPWAAVVVIVVVMVVVMVVV